MMCNVCYNCTDPNVGLSLNEDHSSIKCYMGDTGLLISHTFSENEVKDGNLYKQVLHDNLSINEGMLFENIIAQSLISNGYDLYFYTRVGCKETMVLITKSSILFHNLLKSYFSL